MSSKGEAVCQSLVLWVLSLCLVVYPSAVFPLAGLTEAGYTLEITDYTGSVVYIMGATLHAMVVRFLSDEAAVVADSGKDIRTEVVTADNSSDTDEVQCLTVGRKFLKVEMQCGTTIEVRQYILIVHHQLVKDGNVLVLHRVEV